ncbi:unnamed protein product [Closterium sp. Naga37s-1]|nr:unnamed protein product [Closterium sp. Naga37s-1]
MRQVDQQPLRLPARAQPTRVPGGGQAGQPRPSSCPAGRPEENLQGRAEEMRVQSLATEGAPEDSPRGATTAPEWLREHEPMGEEALLLGTGEAQQQQQEEDNAPEDEESREEEGQAKERQQDGQLEVEHAQVVPRAANGGGSPPQPENHAPQPLQAPGSRLATSAAPQPASHARDHDLPSNPHALHGAHSSSMARDGAEANPDGDASTPVPRGDLARGATTMSHPSPDPHRLPPRSPGPGRQWWLTAAGAGGGATTDSGTHTGATLETGGCTGAGACGGAAADARAGTGGRAGDGAATSANAGTGIRIGGTATAGGDAAGTASRAAGAAGADGGGAGAGDISVAVTTEADAIDDVRAANAATKGLGRVREVVAERHRHREAGDAQVSGAPEDKEADRMALNQEGANDDDERRDASYVQPPAVESSTDESAEEGRETPGVSRQGNATHHRTASGNNRGGGEICQDQY